VFGGQGLQGLDKFEVYNDVWVLDLEALRWHCIVTSAEAPAGRYGHSAVIVSSPVALALSLFKSICMRAQVGSRMYVFGGRGHRGEVFRDVCFVDMQSWSWGNVQVISASPAPR
jgi:host cell factor